MKTLYIVPVRWTKGNMAMEYNLVETKTDLRTKFCKKHCDHVYNGTIIDLMYQIRKYSLIIKENRLIMPDGETAYYFKRFLKGLSK